MWVLVYRSGDFTLSLLYGTMVDFYSSLVGVYSICSVLWIQFFFPNWWYSGVRGGWSIEHSISCITQGGICLHLSTITETFLYTYICLMLSITTWLRGRSFIVWCTRLVVDMVFFYSVQYFFTILKGGFICTEKGRVKWIRFIHASNIHGDDILCGHYFNRGWGFFVLKNGSFLSLIVTQLNLF